MGILFEKFGFLVSLKDIYDIKLANEEWLFRWIRFSLKNVFLVSLTKFDDRKKNDCLNESN